MNMPTKLIEQNELIAIRVPPGDRWRLIDDANAITLESLTEAIESYFLRTKFTGDYRMSPKEGKLFAVKMMEEEIKPKPVRKLNIYGEAEQ